MRLPVIKAYKVVNERQCIDFLAQPPLWSAEGIGWRSSGERPFNNIEIITTGASVPGVATVPGGGNGAGVARNLATVLELTVLT